MDRHTQAGVSVGGLLDSRRTEILRTLESRLRDTGSSLGKDPAVLPECIARADAILRATVTDLARADDVPTEVPDQTGQAPPPGGAGVLMDVVVAELVQLAVERPEALPELSAALAALHRNLASPVRVAGDSYDIFILRTADEARRRERRQLAREVHDELGHELSIAMHQLELGELYGLSDAASADRVSSAREHLASAISIVRRLIVEFADGPATVDLEKEIAAFADTAGSGRTVVHVKVTGNQRMVPDKHRNELFLIVREALLNVFAHAGAQKAVVLVDISTTTITASVRDDGGGFDPERAAARRGFGMVSMGERAASLGGTLEFSSSPGRTVVDVELPLP